ncbi:MAG: hypothetical protein WKG01_08040 [Kofleriaceae bacterium]
MPRIRAVPSKSPLWPSVNTSRVSIVAVFEFEINPPPPRPVAVMLRSSVTSAGVALARSICSNPHFCRSAWSTAASIPTASPCAANAVDLTLRATVR